MSALRPGAIVGWAAVFGLVAQAQAGPSHARVFRKKGSACEVRATAGEYPTYAVFKNGRPIFAPKSDGIVKILFSPSGKRVALSAGEKEGIDLQSGKFEWGMVIVDCETGQVDGYLKDHPVMLDHWVAEDRILTRGAGLIKIGSRIKNY